jgi:hypothetical protein
MTENYMFSASFVPKDRAYWEEQYDRNFAHTVAMAADDLVPLVGDEKLAAQYAEVVLRSHINRIIGLNRDEFVAIMLESQPVVQ